MQQRVRTRLATSSPGSCSTRRPVSCTATAAGCSFRSSPSQVLTALLNRPGEIITREDLRERLWKSDTFVDFDHGLNTAVKKIRRALGDSAETPTFVETLPRRGYRFIAPVRLLSPGRHGVAIAVADLPIAAVATAGTTGASGRRSGSPALAVVAACRRARLAGAELQRRGSRARSPGARATTQLAVMPFRVLDPAQRGCGVPGHRSRGRDYHSAGGHASGRRPPDFSGAPLVRIDRRSGRPRGHAGRRASPGGHDSTHGSGVSRERATGAGRRRGGVGQHLRRAANRAADAPGSAC